jgi:hypothetical protein
VLAAVGDAQGARLTADRVRAGLPHRAAWRRRLAGRFAIVGDSILSVYGCDATGYHGAEHLGQLDADNYRSSGMLLLKDRVVYSWAMHLKRAP